MTVYKTRVFDKKGKVIKTHISERFSSKGEDLIEEWLKRKKFNYRKEKRFSWLLGVNNGEMRLDFYIPSLRIAIEFDGPHHETSDYQKANDAVKNKLLKKKNIRLIRIHYSRMHLISAILNHSIIKKTKIKKYG